MVNSSVVWGGPPFFGPADSTHRQMARAFAALGFKVLYLELGPARGSSRRSSATVQAAERILIAPVPRLPLLPYAMLKSCLELHMRLARRQLERLRDLWAGSRTLFVHRGWFGSHLVRAFPEAVHVYDCVDEHRASSQVEGSSRRVRHVWQKELSLLGSVDITVCVSRRLAEMRGPHTQRCLFLPNATDPDTFAHACEEPGALEELPRPRLLFTGWIGPKIDMKLLLAAAARDAHLTWVVAGGLRVRRPRSCPPNVHFLGTVPHDQVPALALRSDAGVLPLKDNVWNRSNFPLKLCDYMAAGLPVVSTRIPSAEFISRKVPGAVFFADTPEEFARAAREAASCGEEVRARCRAWARSWTWRDRAGKVIDVLRGEGLL